MDNPEKAIYHIRVQGRLDDKWADWFSGFAMTRRESETLLSGTVSDQAELFGILAKINNLGLPLLLAARIECPNPNSKGNCQECAAQSNLPACFNNETAQNQFTERKEQTNE